MSISVQLYSVRDALAADLPGTIRRLADLGFTQVEPFNVVPLADNLASALQENNLSAPTTHAPLLSSDQGEIFAAARRLGISTVIEPYITEEHWRDADGISTVADGLNRAARRASDHGIRVGYHNHWWELETTIGGVSALEYLAGLLDQEVVLEVDAYWAAVGGVEPATLLERLGERVVALHLKDGPKTLDTKAQVPVGRGSMDLPALLSAAGHLEVGVVEFDDYAGDIFDGLAQSLAYLQSLNPGGNS